MVSARLSARIIARRRLLVTSATSVTKRASGGVSPVASVNVNVVNVSVNVHVASGATSWELPSYA